MFFLKNSRLSCRGLLCTGFGIRFLLVLAVLFSLGFGDVRAQQEMPGKEIVPLPGHENINVVILGDSNTSLGGDDCDRPKGWNKWFKDKFAPATCRSYARSGATWTNTAATVYNITENTGRLSNDNVVYNQINRLKEAYGKGEQPAPDLVLVAAGTNDAWFASARPEAFSLTAAQAFAAQEGFITGFPPGEVLTLAESVRYGCEMLMESFPDAQIVLLTPLQSVQAGADGIRKAGDIIEGCARYMGINVIRQDFSCCISRVREKSKKKYTYDGTHTNEEGARRNGCYIANRVVSMLQM